MSKKYLVTGGAGFVGSALAKKLIQKGNNVTIIDNLSTGFLANVPDRSIFIEGDCSSEASIEKLNNEKFDAIFHIAGQSSGEISFENPVYDLNCNTVSTLLLLQYARKTGCKNFIYASTMSVYGDHSKEIVSEEDHTNPKSFYAIGKLASERYLKLFQENYGVNYSSLRYFNIYGPGQNMENMKQGMVSIFMKQILSSDYNEIVVKGDINRFRDFIYINDIVDLTIEALSNVKFQNQIINLGTGIKTTVKEVIETLMEASDIQKPIIEHKGTPGDQFGIYADPSKLNSFVSHEFTPFSKGIETFVKSCID